MTTQTLTTKAVIEAVDKLTGPLKGMGNQINAFALTTQKRLDSLSGSYAKIGASFSKLPLAGGMLGAGFALHGVVDEMMNFDKKLRQVGAVNLMTRGQMAGLQGTIAEITDKTGVLPEKVLEAAEAYQQLNTTMEGFNEVAKIAAKTSVITGSDMAHQITAINAAGKIWNIDMKSAAGVAEVENTFLIAAKGMRGGMHAFEEALKTAGPMARTMGWTLSETAGVIQSLGGQFEAGEIGTAIKTGLARVLAPSNKTALQMAIAGFDPLTYLGFNKDKVAGLGEKLSAGLHQGGFSHTPSADTLQKLAGGFDLSKHEGREAFRLAYMSSLGKLKGEDRKIASATFSQALATLSGDRADPVQFLREMSRHLDDKQALISIFGKDHIAKWLDILRNTHVEERIEHIKELKDRAQFRHVAGTGTVQRRNAIDQRWEMLEDAPSTQYGRMIGNIQNIWNNVSERGVGASLAAMFKEAASFARYLQGVDAARINAIFKGLTLAAAIPAGVFAFRALGGALAALGGVGLGVVSMFGNLARASAVLPWVLEGAGAAVAMRLSPALGGAIAVAGRLAGKLAFLSGAGLAVGGAFYAYEHWSEIMEDLAKFSSTDTGKGLVKSLGELNASAGALGADLLNVINKTLAILNLKPGDGSFAAWVNTLAGAVKGLADATTSAVKELDRLIDKANHQSLKANARDFAGLLAGEDEKGNLARDGFLFKAWDAATDFLGFNNKAAPYGSGSAAFGASWRDQPFNSATTFDRSTPLSLADFDFSGLSVSVDGVGARVDASATTVAGAVDRTTAAVQALAPIMQNAAASMNAARASFTPARAAGPAMGGETGGKR